MMDEATPEVASPGNGREVGTVKWFSPRRGYGFILCPGGDELFFHRNDIRGFMGSLPEEGQAVTFERRQSHKGPEAVGVEILEGQRTG